MSRLVVALRAANGIWAPAGVLLPADGPSSLHSHCPDGDEMLVFACAGEFSVVALSTNGVAVEVPTGARVVVASEDFRELARLGPDERFEREVCLAGRAPIACRWTHEAS
ncbi:MAG TPA: hypothetical protein VH208_04635 [Myxococcaceae bacterium]|nr:hypothetical protein [Myxococcaceae bacterium]